MTTINLNVKIKAGKRTPVEVKVMSTGVNPKVIQFINGKRLDSIDLENWLQDFLIKELQRVENA